MEWILAITHNVCRQLAFAADMILLLKLLKTAYWFVTAVLEKQKAGLSQCSTVIITNTDNIIRDGQR